MIGGGSSHILLRDARLGYDGPVAATLRNLDLFAMYARSDELVANVREQLATPMAYTAGADDPLALAYGQVLPDDLGRDDNYLFFHVDLENPDEPRPGVDEMQLVVAHLRYRKRPNPTPPRHMQDNKSAGRTVGWAERIFAGLGNPVVFVEAQLTLPSEERRDRPPIPPITVGGASLQRSGEEYVGKTIVGEVSKYRWLETVSGTTKIWLAYSHKGLESSSSFWEAEGGRCIGHLHMLGF